VFHSTVDEVKGPNNRIDQQPRGILNLGADYRFRATPFSVGGSFALTPAYETQQTNTQLQKLSTKRVVDAYVLWTINSATKLRLSLSNVAPRDLDTTTSIFEGSHCRPR
jgi:iron complex outermembrane receptor protein